MRLSRLVAPFALILAACAGMGTTTTTESPSTTSSTVAATTTSTTQPQVQEGWALMTAEGLIHSEKGAMPVPGALGWHTLARDRSGGLVFISDGSLWWMRAGDEQPREVAKVDGDLVEVVPTVDGPVARIGLCEPTYIDLADGSEVDEPSGSAVDVACPDGTVTWRASNGLEAMIAGPGVLFDSDGQVAGIEDVAALEIIRDGEVALEIPVGGFYEAYARIHDFDGRFVIVSRGPFEPAMPDETYFVLDLETGETLSPGEHSGASAALLGPDTTTMPALPETDYVHGGEPLFTDDRISQLEDGTYLGFVTYAAEEGLTGQSEIHLDLAVWFGGREADYAALEDGEESPRPNGYYIRNDDPLELVLSVAPAVDVTSVWYHYTTGSDLEPREISFQQFVDAMTGEPSGPQINMLHDPWWVTIVDGEVTAIDEQYVP